MAAWRHFYSDPQWKQYEDAHGGEQMLERSHVLIWRDSPAWQSAPLALPVNAGVHELCMVDLLPHAVAAAHAAYADVDLAWINSKYIAFAALYRPSGST